MGGRGRGRDRWRRSAVAAGLAVALGAGAAGCSDNSVSSPSDLASKAASAGARVTSAASSAVAEASRAVESAGGKVTGAASQVASAVASATKEADRKLEEIKGGVNAKDAVTLGKPATGGDQKTSVKVTVRNTTDSAKSFAVRVDFTDSSGNLLDAVVADVKDVAGGATGTVDAISHRQLTGEVKAEVGTAVRY
ncbi:FxLYD domain-containing protein [Streptomyces yaizuensis]|uniref:FxLYD domain-containing protein n=1 Tax=Streptomyces yaizuensis TaxID=2989713 RepID=A0ABQ5P055_9ACTN|nr:FxLYD domain-containing protein [Streptomyces sp. YSPA8]GLF95855.1 FxLYD domain-containing protein [Streptomyces sp. YSPA8]